MTDEYDDDYATCKYTSAAFRLIHPTLDPDWITHQLQISPSWAYKKGDHIKNNTTRTSKIGIWGLDTEGFVQSRDLRRHIDWLIDILHDKAHLIAELQKQGYRVDIFCHWAGLGGTGGPTLSPRNMYGLALLNIEIGFEFWHENEEEEINNDEQRREKALIESTKLFS
jgi:hypothetical protein